MLPKGALDCLDCEGLVLKPSDIIVRSFDGSKRTVHGEVDLPIKVGSQIFNSTFYIMDIRPTYSYLLGCPWIHGLGAVTSTLHQKLKYPVKGRIVTVCGEEEFMVSHLNSFKYVEMDGEFIETLCHAFEVVPPMVAAAKSSSDVSKVGKVVPKMVSFKDAHAAVEEGIYDTWGKLLEIPFKADKFGLGFTIKAQKEVDRKSVV